MDKCLDFGAQSERVAVKSICLLCACINPSSFRAIEQLGEQSLLSSAKRVMSRATTGATTTPPPPPLLLLLPLPIPIPTSPPPQTQTFTSLAKPRLPTANWQLETGACKLPRVFVEPCLVTTCFLWHTGLRLVGRFCNLASQTTAKAKARA